MSYDLPNRIREIWAKEWEAYVLRTRGKSQAFRSSARFDGGEDAMGRKFKSIWEKAAKYELLAKNPERFIRAQFQDDRKGDPPFPNILLSDVANQKYKKYMENFPTEVTKALKCQQETARASIQKWLIMGMTMDKAIIVTILDTEVSLSALFRYCLASELTDDSSYSEEIRSKFNDVANEIYEAAGREYDVWPEVYQKVWKDFIPSWWYET